ncbi:MAG: RAD55 family ATPase [Candidatus Hodarchaeales archaeon]
MIQKHKIIRTNVQSLDLFLGGEENPGLPNKSVILVLGEPGTKFEIFVQQILFHTLKSGATDKVVYLSYDGRPDEIIDEMDIYNYNLQPFVMAGEKWKVEDRFAQDSLRFFTRRFIPEISKYDNVCTCIHSISSLIRSNSIESVSIAMETLKYVVRDLGTGLHFILMVKNLHDPSMEVLASHIADFVFDISFGRVGAGKIAINFSVQKSWKSILLPISVPMTIDRKGIRLETTVRV